MCNPSGPDLLYVVPIAVCLFYLPSALISIICLVKMIILVKRQHTEGIRIGNMTGHFSETLVRRKAIKIVMLVSGNFWITAALAFIVRYSIFSSGVSLIDMGTRHNVTAYIIVRTSYFLMTTVYLLINPVIYLIVHHALRRACCKPIKLTHEHLPQSN